MSKIIQINPGPDPMVHHHGKSVLWRQVLFVASVAIVSVGGSLAATIVQIGWQPSAFYTAALVPLIVSVPVATYLVRQRTRIQALNAQLAELVRRDPLTGLLNRRAFLAAAQAAQRQGGGLVFADADHFKGINDTFGHLAGDSVLVALSEHIGRAAGHTGCCGRLGGEEFALFLPGLTTNECHDRCQTLRLAIEQTSVRAGSHDIFVTISLGICMVPVATTDLSAYLAMADKALYAAKAAGRNRAAWAAGDADLPQRAVG